MASSSSSLVANLVDGLREAPEPEALALEEPSITREEMVTMGLRAARVPVRYMDATWDSYRLDRPALREAHGEKAEALFRRLSEFRQWRGEPSFAYLYGPPGTGKTHLAVQTIRRWVEAGGREARFLVVPEFLEAIKGTFKGDGSASRLIGQAQSAEFLVLDDLGTEVGTEWEGGVLYEVLNYRYNRPRSYNGAPRPTVITSNLTPSEVASGYHARLGSRLGSGIGVDLSILPDFRLTRKETKP